MKASELIGRKVLVRTTMGRTFHLDLFCPKVQESEQYNSAGIQYRLAKVTKVSNGEGRIVIGIHLGREFEECPCVEKYIDKEE